MDINNVWLAAGNGSRNASAADSSGFGSRREWERKLPYAVRTALAEEYLEAGRRSLLQQYFETLLDEKPPLAQELLTNLYYTAVQYKQHMTAWNVMVVLSQLPYEKMIPWAAFVALAATNSIYQDVQEMGIRCYENWEDKGACLFLGNCAFGETWLQEYADEVCHFVMEEGRDHVLFEKNQPWKMAERERNSASNTERYSSGHSDSRVSDRQEPIIPVGSWNAERCG